MIVIDSNGKEVNPSELGDRNPINILSQKQKAEEMKKFLEDTAYTLGAKLNNCLFALQPFGTQDRVFILRKEKVTDSEILKKAYNPEYEPTDDKERYLLKSIYETQNKEKTEYWHLYFQPILFERNLYDSVCIDVSPKAQMSYYEFMYENSQIYLFDDDEYNHLKEKKKSDNAILHRGCKLYSLGGLTLDSTENLLSNAQEIDPNIDYLHKLVEDVYNYGYMKGIYNRQSHSNTAMLMIHNMQENPYRNIYPVYQEVKAMLKDNWGDKVSNIRYNGNIITFNSPYNNNEKIYVCNRPNSTSDKPMFYFNGMDLYSMEGLKQYCGGTDGKGAYMFQPQWYKEMVVPIMEKEVEKPKQRVWGKIINDK